MTERPFNQRLKDALASGSSAIVATMIGESEVISVRAMDDAKAARARALDPLLDDAEIEAARKATSDAEFTQARMAEAARILKAKREEFRGEEDQAERRKVYAAALAKRDEAAARLAEFYPTLANQIGTLLAEVKAADEAAEDANRSLPNGAGRIESVDLIARPNFKPYKEHPKLTRMTLPAFDAEARVPTWGRSGIGVGMPAKFTANPIRSAGHDAPGEAAPTAAPAGEEGVGVPSSPPGPVRLVPRMTGEAA